LISTAMMLQVRQMIIVNILHFYKHIKLHVWLG